MSPRFPPELPISLYSTTLFGVVPPRSESVDASVWKKLALTRKSVGPELGLTTQ
jgi:hypothetical protein